jgi:prolipoprotein diacylglyceryl transferase
VNHLFAAIPSPDISFVQLGPIRIHFYALFILAGIAVALIVGNQRLKSRGAKKGELLDISLWVVPIGLVGARFFHVVTHWADYFGAGKNFVDVFKIWEGGIAIYGGVIGGLLGAWIGSRMSGIRLVSYLDAIAPGVLLAQGIGRIGNYFNSELFGQPTNLPWGISIDPSNPAYPVGLPAGVAFHPTFAYELLWDVLGAVALILIDRKFALRWGRLFGLYLVVYSTGRYFIEGLRLDPSDIYFGLRTNQWSAVIGVLLGLAIFYLQQRRHTGSEVTVYLDGREPIDEPVNTEDDEKPLDSKATSTD